MTEPKHTSQKRSHESIDLTQSDGEEVPPPKTSRSSNHTSASARGMQRIPRRPTPEPQMPNPPGVSRANQRLHATPTSSVPTPSSPDIDLTGDNDDDETETGNELMSGTQAETLQNELYQRYGTAATKVVGIQYYDGLINAGERVIVSREPGNQYDSNALRVDNIQRQQIGHIPRRMAAKLAPYLDAGDLFIEGTLTGHAGGFDVPINIAMYGPGDPEHMAAIKQRMERDRLDIKDLKQRDRDAEKRRKEELKKVAKAPRVEQDGSSQWANGSADTSDDPKTASMEEIIGSSQVFNPREMGEMAEKFGAQETDLAKMPMAEQPKRLATKLLPYQRQGLAWLSAQENPQLPQSGSDQVVQLWKQPSKGLFTNIATNFGLKDQEPILCRGGILADDMGLGKTLEVIALIVADKLNNEDAGPTLIISPVSIMSNWSGQIERHVSPDNPLRVLTYHGSGRKTMRPKDFSQYDVIITTYGTLSTEFMPKGSKGTPKLPKATGLYSFRWRRIVLDEGHNIRNPNTKNALAACGIDAYAHWALTGTPIINSLKDLFSLVKFIGLTGGLNRLEVFNSVLMRPVREGRTDAQMLLSALMATICLRRRKDMSFIDLKLPELTEYVHRVQFANHEQKKYDALQDEAKGMLKSYADASGHGNAQEAQQSYRGLLEVLLRLRQVCNHWKMCEERVSKLMNLLDEQTAVDLTPENRRALQDLLQLSIESREDCAICLDTLHNPVITHCGHSFGNECITRVIETQHKCPMCRAELKDETVVVPPAAEFGDDSSTSSPDTNEDTETSTKLEALLKICSAAHKIPGTKIVVFSQWCRFLDLLQPRLATQGYTTTRIDGTMPAAARDSALRALDSDPHTTIMLASLGVCAVGLNLVAADTVVLCDSWWAPAIEDQAVDRVHRLGQTRPTTVWRLVMEGSIEERTLEIQKDKRTLMALATGEGPEQKKRREGARGRSLRDIRRLLD